MLDFPRGVYADVRTEEVLETSFEVVSGECLEDRERRYRAAFLRVYDGHRWYYQSTTDLARLQETLDELAALARSDGAVEDSPLVRAFEVHRGEHLHFVDRELDRVPREAKRELVRGLIPLVEGRSEVLNHRGTYADRRELRTFHSSLGADLTWDTQRAGCVLGVELGSGERNHKDRFFVGGQDFSSLGGQEQAVEDWLETALEYLRHAEPVRPGTYTTVFSPATTGVFAHECFGHKSEADFMVGDEAALEEWSLGERIGSEILSIYVDGTTPCIGFTPFDDEGTRGRKVPLIEEGRLAGRLHSVATAAALGEPPTGNGRAIDYRYEPIPRQTNTFVGAGTSTREEVFGGIEDGIFVDTFRHGSGMSTFTIAPARAYRIVDGKIADPVRVSVVSGSVFEALASVEALSDQVEIQDIITAGCGKMEQMGLPVSLGGPYMRVRGMRVA